MGNDLSNANNIMDEVTIDDDYLSKTDIWTVHNASNDEQELIVFKNQRSDISQLEKLSQKLKCYRHPNILKFIHGVKNGEDYLVFTEHAIPLIKSTILNHKEINLGLSDLIKAVDFLHDRGKVCVNYSFKDHSIYITKDGRWKLGALHDIIIVSDQGIKRDYKYLSEFILSLNIQDTDFVNYVRDKFSQDSSYCLHDLLNHRYFQSSDLIYIVDYLTDLPLKTDKSTFFSELSEKLFEIDEDIVSQNLNGLLLSRYVMMDPDAQEKFIPDLLTPYDSELRPRFNKSNEINSILSESRFKKAIIPKLVDIFFVHEIQIRHVLLNNFTAYVHLFPRKILEEEILPQILLGMKDEHDELVAKTLNALAVLVPILGSAKVIGKKNRRKLFSDGSPLSKTQSNGVSTVRPRLLSEERHSPIGAETDDDNGWNDVPWGDEEEIIIKPEVNETKIGDSPSSVNKSDPLESLDIKSSKNTNNSVDYFADMTPNIEKTKPMPIKTKFDIVVDETPLEIEADGDGWANDDDNVWEDF